MIVVEKIDSVLVYIMIIIVVIGMLRKIIWLLARECVHERRWIMEMKLMSLFGVK